MLCIDPRLDLSRLQLSIKALGLRYAGTGCSSASSTLLYYLNYFKRLRDAGGSTHASELVMSLGRNFWGKANNTSTTG